MSRRFFSVLLSGLLAWSCVGAVESAAASQLGQLRWAADSDQVALAQVIRPEGAVRRPSLDGRNDNHLGRSFFVAGLSVPRPAAARFELWAANVIGAARSGSSKRTSRGPPR